LQVHFSSIGATPPAGVIKKQFVVAARGKIFILRKYYKISNVFFCFKRHRWNSFASVGNSEAFFRHMNGTGKLDLLRSTISFLGNETFNCFFLTAAKCKLTFFMESPLPMAMAIGTLWKMVLMDNLHFACMLGFLWSTN